MSNRAFGIELVRTGLRFLRRGAKNKHVFVYCPRLPKPLGSGRHPGEPSALKALQQASPLGFAAGRISALTVAIHN
jgi:hypothetical protein